MMEIKPKIDNKPFIVTVSQLSTKIYYLLKGEKSFENIYVKGEVTDLSHYAKKGYTYFTLKDGDAILKCAIFDNDAKVPAGGLANGMSVIAHGTINLYRKGGYHQLVVKDVEKIGTGPSSEELKKLKEKLSKEGLFQKKRPLPKMPSKICIITAPDKDAINDFRKNILLRYPLVTLIEIPAVVQGADAPDSLVEGIKKANETDADVILIGRGGGPDADLSAFNDEKVLRALYASRLPTVSAVGHDEDKPLSDDVCDFRVSTPSVAAVDVVPDINELVKRMDSELKKMGLLVKSSIERKKSDVMLLETRVKAASPRSRLENSRNTVDRCITSVQREMRRMLLDMEKGADTLYGTIASRSLATLERKERSFLNTTKVIETLNPLAVLTRGYSITYSEGKALKSSDNVKPGDKIKITLSEGTVNAVVESTERKN